MRIMTPNHQYPTNASVCLWVSVCRWAKPGATHYSPPSSPLHNPFSFSFSALSAPFPLSSPFSRSPPPAALSHFPHSRCAAVRGTDDSKIWENCVTH